MKCPSCGLENEEGAKFCQSCGAPMGEAAATSAPEEGAAPPPTAEGAPPPPPPPPSSSGPSAGSKETDWGWISKGFNEVMSDIGSYAILGLVVALCTFFTAGILGGPLFAGSWVVIRRKLRGEGKIEIGEVFSIGFEKFLPTFLVFWPVLVVYILLSMIPVVGWIFSIVAGGLLVPFFGISLHYIMEESMEFMDAAKGAWGHIMGNFINLWLFGFVAALIIDIGFFLCIIPGFFTLPAMLVAIALMLNTWFPKN